MERDKKKKKLIIKFVMVVLLFVTLLGSITAFFYLKNADQEMEKKKSKKIETSMKKESKETKPKSNLPDKYVYNNLEALYFMNTEQVGVFKEKLEKHIEDEKYSEITTISIQDNVEKIGENEYRFRIDTNNADKDILECVCNPESKIMTFAIYSSINAETPPTEPKRIKDITKPNNSVDLNTVDGTDGMAPSNYETGLTVINEQNLTTILPAETCTRMKQELLAYLITENEFRRALTLNVESIVSSEENISFQIAFDTPRTDHKNITVGYLIKSDSFVFVIE